MLGEIMILLVFYNGLFILYSSLQMDIQYTLTIYLSLIDCPVLCEKTNIKSDFDEGCRVLSVSAVGDVI